MERRYEEPKKTSKFITATVDEIIKRLNLPVRLKNMISFTEKYISLATFDFIAQQGYEQGRYNHYSEPTTLRLLLHCH